MWYSCGLGFFKQTESDISTVKLQISSKNVNEDHGGDVSVVKSDDY